MKQCKDCGEKKVETDFYGNRKTKNGTDSSCKICRRLVSKVRQRNIRNTQKYKDYNREYQRNYEARRVKNDEQYKLAKLLRIRLSVSMKRVCKPGSAVRNLGCSVEEFKKYIESKFQTGMSWENWSRNGWHIDHVKPLSKFDLSDREQFLEACHYTNLQPLWSRDNLVKGNR